MNDQSLTQTMNQSHMLNRSYGVWPSQVPLPPLPEESKSFHNLNQQRPPGFGGGRSNWKGKKGGDNKWKEKQQQRKEMMMMTGSIGSVGGGGGGGGGNGSCGGGYKPPTLHELQSQNRLKARRFYPKKKFNNRFAPFAPRNTTSFIIRAKKSGGIASLVSPCPVTPAILPTPIFSPSREVLGDMAKEEWGVDDYGSMNGLIRLRMPGNEVRGDEEDDEEGGGGSSESDVEEHVEVERRLDHDLSRFEMIYPTGGGGDDLAEDRVDDQDSHITQLAEENLTLKERLFLMEKELGDLRRRLIRLEAERGLEKENIDDEASENEGCGDVCSEKSVGDGD